MKICVKIVFSNLGICKEEDEIQGIQVDVVWEILIQRMLWEML